MGMSGVPPTLSILISAYWMSTICSRCSVHGLGAELLVLLRSIEITEPPLDRRIVRPGLRDERSGKRLQYTPVDTLTQRARSGCNRRHHLVIAAGERLVDSTEQPPAVHGTKRLRPPSQQRNGGDRLAGLGAVDHPAQKCLR